MTRWIIWVGAALWFGMAGGPARADACALAAGDGGLWDQVGTVTQMGGASVLGVMRFEARTEAEMDSAKPSDWTYDVPSASLPKGTVCDRVQLESALRMQPKNLPFEMWQGERVPHGLDLAATAPELAARIADKGRRVDLPAGRVFVYHVDDLDDPDWREALFDAAEKAGTIDTARFVLALPGALYLVPMK